MIQKQFRITGLFSIEESKKIKADMLKGEKMTDYLRRKLNHVLKKKEVSRNVSR